MWRPTSAASFAVPWLGFVRPLLLSSPTQIALPGPYALTSDAYTRDDDEVKAFGRATGSARTPDQTETALFWSVNPLVQYRGGATAWRAAGSTRCRPRACSRSSTRRQYVLATAFMPTH